MTDPTTKVQWHMECAECIKLLRRVRGKQILALKTAILEINHVAGSDSPFKVGRLIPFRFVTKDLKTRQSMFLS